MATKPKHLSGWDEKHFDSLSRSGSYKIKEESIVTENPDGTSDDVVEPFGLSAPGPGTTNIPTKAPGAGSPKHSPRSGWGGAGSDAATSLSDRNAARQAQGKLGGLA